MKSIYQRHIFTWAEESILARSPGWGIAASSTPRDKQGLRELEKMASAGKADYSGGIPAEMLLYSASCGFVKMRVTPRKSGNVGRRNKYVQMYQLTGEEETPVAYLYPGRDWGDPETDGFLSPLEIDLPRWTGRDILLSLGLQERLKDLLPLVYRTVSGELSQLNLVAPDWAEEDFAGKAEKTMFLIHEIIPSILRKQAGYLSFSRVPVKGVSFVFSPAPLGSPCFYLNGKDGEESGEESRERESSDRDPGGRECLETEFFSWMADSYLRDDGELSDFLGESDRLLGNLKNHAGALKKLEYLWLGSYGESSSPKDTEILLRLMPDILFLGEAEPGLRQTARRIRERIHAANLSEAERISYIKRLMSGCTMKSLGPVAEEILWALSAGFDWDKRKDALMQDIKERNRVLYQKITGEYEPADQEWSVDDGIPVIVPDLEERQLGENSVEKTSQAIEEETDRIRSEVPLPETGQGEASGETRDDSLGFILTGIVQGFMTGCMIYLAHYTIRLGHWKIALGLFGIWILLLCNYWYILRQKGEWRPLWKIWGLCLTEGLLIDMTAWFFPDQRIRLYFFIILGILVFLMQMAAMIQLIGKQGKDSRKEG